jgi:VanZ family protein
MHASTSTTPLRLASLLLPPLAVMAVIFYLSSQPSTAHYPVWEVVVRKVGHAGGYALLAFTLWRAFRGLLASTHRFVPVLAAVAVSVAYAVSDELHQTLVTGRHGSPVDVLIDSVGIVAAAVLAARLSRPPRDVGTAPG